MAQETPRMKPLYPRVKLILRDPVDRFRWVLILACGHRESIGAEREPKLNKIFCPKCMEANEDERAWAEAEAAREK